jgi:hypothetical protein
LYQKTIGPATLEVRSDSEGQTISLADVLRVVVTLDGDKGLEVEAPVDLKPGTGWEVLSRTKPEFKKAEDGKFRWRQTLTLVPQALGEQAVSLTPLIYRTAKGEAQSAEWQPFPVTVETRLKNADPKQARDITATLDPPRTAEQVANLWLWWSVPAALAALAAAGLWLVRRHPARRTPTSAQRKAVRECDRLRAMKLAERGQGKKLVVLLAGVVRRYLERRYDIPARRQTTTELLQHIEPRRDLDQAAKRWLHGFFTQADQIKFAGAEVTAERGAALVDEVRQFCQATTETRESLSD